MWSTALEISPALILSCSSSSTTGGPGWGVVGGVSWGEVREPLERDLMESLGDLNGGGGDECSTVLATSVENNVSLLIITTR